MLESGWLWVQVPPEAAKFWVSCVLLLCLSVVLFCHELVFLSTSWIIKVMYMYLSVAAVTVTGVGAPLDTLL